MNTEVDYLSLLKECLPLVKEFSLLIFGAIGSYVALKGLGTWKKQLKGKDEYELCKKLLIDLYKYKKGISIVRNPAMFQYEYENPSDTDNFNNKEKQYKNLSYAYQQRWVKVEEYRIILDLSIIESKIYWNEELKKLFDPIFTFENKLFKSVQDTLLMNNPNVNDEYKKVVGKIFHEENRSEILYFLGDKDPYAKVLEENIKNIENFIQKKLKK